MSTVFVVHSGDHADRDAVYGVFSRRDRAEVCRLVVAEGYYNLERSPRVVLVSEWVVDGEEVSQFPPDE